MTKVYDFSVFDMKEHNFAFAEMTETEIAAKKAEFEAFQKSKQETKAVPAAETGESKPAPLRPAGAKPVFKPKIKPPGSSSS